MKATPEEIAKCLDDTIASMRKDIERIADRIQFLCEHHWRVCKVGVMPSPDYCGIRFDGCERDEVIAVMKAFGGKWDKSPHYSGKGIDYTQWFDDFRKRVEISCAKPPPSCKVVEEDEVIPAQPERVVKKFKLQCVKPVEGEAALLPVPEPAQVQSVTEITPQELEANGVDEQAVSEQEPSESV